MAKACFAQSLLSNAQEPNKQCTQERRIEFVPAILGKGNSSNHQPTNPPTSQPSKQESKKASKPTTPTTTNNKQTTTNTQQTTNNQHTTNNRDMGAVRLRKARPLTAVEPLHDVNHVLLGHLAKIGWLFWGGTPRMCFPPPPPFGVPSKPQRGTMNKGKLFVSAPGVQLLGRIGKWKGAKPLPPAVYPLYKHINHIVELDRQHHT